MKIFAIIIILGVAYIALPFIISVIGMMLPIILLVGALSILGAFLKK